MRRALVIGAILTLATNARSEVCSISSTTSVSFESYNVFDSAPALSVGSITYECTGVQPVDRIVIELGGISDTATLRTMTAGARALGYQLYLDAARTIVWGSGTGGTSTYGPLQPADGVPIAVPIYGQVPAHQDVPAGSYGDTVVVTLQF